MNEDAILKEFRNMNDFLAQLSRIASADRMQEWGSS
jgi:hypothetical protein